MVSISIENFRSFEKEQTLSLVASRRYSGAHDGHALAIPNSEERVLKTAVMYGANGAGKSNIFKALKYLRSIAIEVRKKNSGTGREPFRFGDNSNKFSTFSVQFIANENLYEFGVKVDDVRVAQEWLMKIDGSKEKNIYERITDDNGRVVIESDFFKKDGGKVAALATVGGPQNQSFLATIIATLEEEDIGAEILSIIDWFSATLKLIEPNQSIAPLGHLLSTDDKFLKFAGDFLKSSSTGVDYLDVKKQEITEDELLAALPERLAKKLFEDMSSTDNNTAIVHMGDGNELLVERTDENHYYRVTIQGAHRCSTGSSVSLDLSEESDGTRRLLNLIPALNHPNDGAVYFIDEIDRSMHPMLIWKFLEFFLTSCKADRHQIVVTTHESNLLDLELLRRDEIWFVEKDQDAATNLYPLTDFKVRKDLEIRKHYLEGRFGAVPFLGSLNQLLEERTLSA